MDNENLSDTHLYKMDICFYPYVYLPLKYCKIILKNRRK